MDDEKNKNQEKGSGAKVVETAAKGAETYFLGTGGAITDIAKKDKTVGKVIDKAGEVVDKTPIVKDVAKGLDKSGLLDTANKAMGLIGGKGNAAGAANAAGKGTNLLDGAGAGNNLPSDGLNKNAPVPSTHPYSANADAANDKIGASEGLDEKEDGFGLNDVFGSFGKKKKKTNVDGLEADGQLDDSVGDQVVAKIFQSIPKPVWWIVLFIIAALLIVIVINAVKEEGILLTTEAFFKTVEEKFSPADKEAYDAAKSEHDYDAQRKILEDNGLVALIPDKHKGVDGEERYKKEIAYYDRVTEVKKKFKDDFKQDINLYLTNAAMFNHISFGDKMDATYLKDNLQNESINRKEIKYKFVDNGVMTRWNEKTGQLEHYNPDPIKIPVYTKDYSTIKKTFASVSRMQLILNLYHFVGCDTDSDGNSIDLEMPENIYMPATLRDIANNDSTDPYKDWFPNGGSTSEDEMNIRVVLITGQLDEHGACHMDPFVDYELSLRQNPKELFYWNLVDEGFLPKYYPDYMPSEKASAEDKEKFLESMTRTIIMQAEDVYVRPGSSSIMSDGEIIFGSGSAGAIPGGALSGIASPLGIGTSSIRLTGCYGVYGSSNCSVHNGVDLITGSSTTPITSIADGTVVGLTKNSKQCEPVFTSNGAKCAPGCSGNIITIEHNINGQVIRSMYVHMSSINSNLAVGTRVRQGEQIGIIGTSGCSTGVHLHFQLLDASGKLYNPEEVLKQIGVSVPSSCQAGRNSCLK